MEPMPCLEDIPEQETLLPFLRQFVSIMSKIKLLWSCKKNSLKGHKAVAYYDGLAHTILLKYKQQIDFKAEWNECVTMSKTFMSMFALKKEKESCKKLQIELQQLFILIRNMYKD